MKTVTEHLWDRLRDKFPIIEVLPPLSELKSTQWSREFESLMRNRLIMGGIRYGLLNANGKKKYDRLGSIRERVDRFHRTENAECLVDIANLAMLEYEEGGHGFQPEDDGEHVK